MNTRYFEIWDGDLFIGIADEVEAARYFEAGFTVVPCEGNEE